MIYLAVQKETQTLAVPRSDGHAGTPGAMTLSLRRGGQTVAFAELLDLAVNELYYLLEVEGADRLEVGEYDYTLTDYDGREVSCGILTAGDYVRKTVAPKTDRKIIEYGG